MAKVGAHRVVHLCPNRKGTTFSELLQFSFSLEMKAYWRTLSLPGVGGWKSDGRVTSDISQLTAVFWQSQCLERLHCYPNQKQKEQQPSKLNIWVSKKKKLLIFYSIHATARERKQRTCSRMEVTLIPVLPNLISEGPDKLEEAIKVEWVGWMQCQLHPWKATFLLQRKDRNTLL